MRGRFRHDDSGASALEFALLAVPLLLMLVGTIEYGRALWTQQAMQSLAIAAARCIGISQSECSTSGAYSSSRTNTYVIAEAARLGVALQNTNITVNANTSCQGVSGFATVAISYSFVSAAPAFITALLVGPTLRANACFPNQA